MTTIRNVIIRQPLAFSLLIALAMFGLAFASRAALPTLAPETVANVFQVLAALLAVGLLTGLGWWREAGFNRPSRWRNLHLLWFPLLVSAFVLLGGVKPLGVAAIAGIALSVLVTAFSEEALFRGVVWRALLPTGVMRTAIITAVLFGMIHFAKPIVFGGSVGSAIPLVIFTICGGFTYSALRYRTASIWPPILFHFTFNFVSNISTPESVPYLILMLSIAGTVGFLAYGLFLLHNERVRADSGLTGLDEQAWYLH